MKHGKLKRLIFMALCCDLGIVSKKLIAPAANLLTDLLRIPGGISASFSLMFLVLAAAFVPRFGAATLMGAVQSGIAVCMGTVGSMGALAPLSYILPGIVIDSVLLLSRRLKLERSASLVYACIFASFTACLTANSIVFHLRGTAFWLYGCVAALSGAVCGVLAGACAKTLDPVLGKDIGHEKNADRDPVSATADGCACSAVSEAAQNKSENIAEVWSK